MRLESCRVLVAETMVKRKRMARDILFSTLLPEMLIAVATILIVWFGVKRGLGPLAKLSDEIKARSPGDLRPIPAAGTPEETQPLVSALNGLLEEVSQASRNQQRFLANAAHQLRTPLAGLQAHTELALAKPLPPEVRAELEQVHQATIRTARLANQLLALARAEPGARGNAAELNLKTLAEGEADAWVHQALARDVDLGFELRLGAGRRRDVFLLRRKRWRTWCTTRSSIRSAAATSRLRTGRREAHSFLEVEDDAGHSRRRSASACSSVSIEYRARPAPGQRLGPRHRARDRGWPWREHVITEEPVIRAAALR